MAVYSSQRDGQQYRCIEVTRRFKVFDTVIIICRDGRKKEGEIIFIDKDNIHITGPYVPIEKIKLKEILDVEPWEPPESWK